MGKSQMKRSVESRGKKASGVPVLNRNTTIIVLIAFVYYLMFHCGGDDSAGVSTVSNTKSKSKGSKFQTPDVGGSKKKNKYSRPGSKSKSKKSSSGGDGYDFDDETADHAGKAMEFDAAGDKEGCVNAFGAAAHFDPANAGMHMNHGVSLMRMYRFDEAEHAYKKAHKLTPTDKGLKENMKANEDSRKIMAEGGGGEGGGEGGGGGGGGKKKKNKYSRPGAKGKAGKKNKYQRKKQGGDDSGGGGGDQPDPTQEAIRLDGEGDKEGSLEMFRKAAAQNPTASTLMNLGVSLMRAIQLDEAEAFMLQAKELAAPDDKDVQANLEALEGWKQHSQQQGGGGDGGGAAKKKKNKYERPGKKGGAAKKKSKYQRKGDAAAGGGGGGQPAAAAAARGAGEGEDALQAEIGALTQAAIAADQTGDLEKVAGLFKEALAKAPQAPNLLLNVGVSLMRIANTGDGDYAEAEKYMREAEALNPTDKDAQDNIRDLEGAKAYKAAGGEGGGEAPKKKKKKKNKYQKA